jgi:hypothetical protein
VATQHARSSRQRTGLPGYPSIPSRRWNGAWLHCALAVFVAVVGSSGYAAEKRYGPDEAINHVGERATVCGDVVSANFVTNMQEQPTFLNLAKRYPNEVFTAVIWGVDRARFDYAPENLQGASICVSGEITTYRGIAQIIVRTPDQIRRR